MYSVALGWMCEERLERSERTIVSFWIVARRPRWEVEVMRLPRAVLSS
jgi:hypothetical protein